MRRQIFIVYGGKCGRNGCRYELGRAAGSQRKHTELSDCTQRGKFRDCCSDYQLLRKKHLLQGVS